MDLVRIAYDILSPGEEFVQEAFPVLAVVGAIVGVVFIASMIVLLILLKKKRRNKDSAAVQMGNSNDSKPDPENEKK